MGSHSPTYLHGTSPEEQRRLALMNDLLNEASLREMGLRGGEKIIDFGCATGRMSLAMARAAGPAGKVVGIEINSEQVAQISYLRSAARDLGQTADLKNRCAVPTSRREGPGVCGPGRKPWGKSPHPFCPPPPRGGRGDGETPPLQPPPRGRGRGQGGEGRIRAPTADESV